MNLKQSILLCCLCPLLAWSQSAPEPYGALPSERQLRWHEMEMYTLIHYTPTTFQNKEWGYGDADPEIFNPSNFDADQIARAAASGGFKGLISVAKHHDGFCLWPTSSTNYSIKQSPWKDGKGDMVKAFMQAARKQNLAFGVYLSAWDRNDTRYGTSAYTDAYRVQLTELMTSYGPLFASWHDGANGGDGYYGGRNEKRVIDQTSYYQWPEKTWPIVRRLQPMAMIFSDIGPDMRWVGNEQGAADPQASWATITPKGIGDKPAMPGAVDGSNLPTGDRGGKFWIPAECDVPLRPGWFYHADQDSKVKSPDSLFQIYLQSVGRGGGMNLGLAPMPEGRLHENDVRVLAAFGRKLKETFAVNLAQGAVAQASNVRGNSPEFSTDHLFDQDRYSYYASDDQELSPSIRIELDGEKEFDLIRLRENIKLGQRLDSVHIEIQQSDGSIKHIKVSSIGANRLIKLEHPVRSQVLEVKLFAPVAPTLSDFALFKIAPSEPVEFIGKRKLLSSEDIQLISADKDASKAVDGDEMSLWQSHLGQKTYVELKLSSRKVLSALGYLPRRDGSLAGVPQRYRVAVSQDGKAWQQLVSGEFSNIKANPTRQMIYFPEDIQVHYLRFYPLDILEKENEFSVAEFELYSSEQ